MYRKEIIYDRETRDYAIYLDGELMGFERTYHSAEVYLDQLVFELMVGQHFPPPVDVVAPMLIPEGDILDTDGMRVALPALEVNWNSGPVALDPPPGFPDDDDGTEDGGGPPNTITPLLVDIAAVLDMALGDAPAKDIVPELRRIRARIAQTIEERGPTPQEIAAHLESVTFPNWRPATIAANDIPF